MASGQGPGASGQWPVASLHPARFHEIPVLELLRAAAQGWIGVDRRLIRSIVARGDTAAGDIAQFVREPTDKHRIILDPVLVDLFRYFRSPQALDFFIEAIRRSPEDVDDSLIEGLLPLREQAVEPLLKLYEELGEEYASDVAFLLASLRVRDGRVLELLLDRLEFDAADGAFCLGLYGDEAARPALERMLQEIPEEASELRHEISYALEAIRQPEPPYDAASFDLYEEYPETDTPAFEVLPENERIQMLASEDPEIRAEAAYSFFNADLPAKARTVLWELAKSDPDAAVRARAWASLCDAADDDAIRSAMLAVLQDNSRPPEERGGAAVGLYPLAERAEVRAGIEALYQEGGKGRAKALEAMWRGLYKPFAKYFAPHIDDPDREIRRQALRGAGYFRLTASADQIREYFDDEDLREDALFAYTLAMPGETTRGRARGMLRKIDSLAHLSASEARLVTFAIDERLRLFGLEPVFERETEEDQEEPEEEAPPPVSKVGRNDPCPCGSGKKFKKCHGA